MRYPRVIIPIFFLGVPMWAQMQIGGGTCSTASLNGPYSLTLTGRDLSSSVTYTNVSQGVGTATFDGLSAVTLTLITNTNQATATQQTLSGTYTMQANCVGTATITSGDKASFAIESHNQGKAFLLTGQDGVYAFTGSGSTLPSGCSASQVSGTYAFNGTGFNLTTSAIAGVFNISGTLTFDGKSVVSGTWYQASGASNTTYTVSGQFAVATGCTGNATVSDSLGNTYSLHFTLTSASGSNFLISASSPLAMFTGSGRIL